MCVFSQGDRGKPGPAGPSGEPGEKVRGVFMFTQVCVSVCTGCINVCVSQGSEGPNGPRGQPGDAVSNTHTYNT